MSTPYERIQARNRELDTSSDWTPTPRTVKKPEPRHACVNCNKPVSNGRRSGEIDSIDPARLFCTLRCAASFGIASHAAGMRRKAL